ncbi:MAG: tetratricopeptide repeat protein [Pirellulales bacterium]|nr:tetratricopeptide repeat protein [Pirellulales bacterium]
MRPIALLLALAVPLILSVRPAFAGGGAANVAVIINAESWASLTIANEFIALRDVPVANVVYLNDVPGFETVDVDVFRAKILAPALEALERRGLGAQIDYLVYSSDFPYGVNLAKDIGNAKVHQVVTKVGSLTGLTYLCQLVRGKQLYYLDINSNRYYRPLDTVNPGEEFTNDESAIQKTATAIELIQQGKHRQAADIFTELTEKHPKSVLAAYSLACCEAQLGNPVQAVKHLERAIELGWWNIQHTQADENLANLRDRDDFKQLIARMKDRVINVGESQGFRTMYAWDESFQKAAPNRGIRYLISSMLAATSGRGTSVNEALKSLRRAKSADGTRPDGTIYFMDNKNIRAETRSWGFASAKSLLKDLGVNAEIINDGTILPRNKRSIAGLMAGYASFNLKDWGSTIVPGAFCEHLTSYGGVLKQDADQMALSEWIAAGATGSSGAVTEPYALQWKFPTPFMHVHYARGSTLGEAYYQSVQMPYQLLLVGDPLCTPWAAAPQFRVEGVRSGESVTGRLSLTAQATDGKEFKQFEFYIDGRRVGMIKPQGTFEMDTTKAPDGHHELGVVAIADNSLETQGIQTIPLTFANHDNNVTLSTAKPGVIYGEPVLLDVKATGADEVVVLQNGRLVGRLAANDGDVAETVDVVTNMLGMGDVEFVAVAMFGNKPTDQAISRPVKVTIFPPKAMLGVARPRGELTAGVQVTNAASQTTLIDSLGKAEWLKTADVGDGEFTINTFISVPGDDLYQFQCRSDSKVSITLDDVPLTRPQGEGGDGKWKYAPLHLRRGWHKLEIKVGNKAGDAKPNGFGERIDVRFGGHGTRSLDGTFCRAIKE